MNESLLFVNVDLSGVKPGVAAPAHRHPSDVSIAGYSDAILRFIADRGEGVALVTYVDRIDSAYTLQEKLDAAEQHTGRKKKLLTQTPTHTATSHTTHTTGSLLAAKAQANDAAPTAVLHTQSIVPGLQNKTWKTARVFISSTFR